MFSNARKILKTLKHYNKFVFYSESRHYQKYYYNFIYLLNKKNKKIIYASSDKNDTIDLNNVTNIFIGEGFLRSLFFLLIRTKNFFLTVTDLNNNVLKKNSYVKNYIYIFHAAVSTHKAYTKSAFENYDTIMCIGNYHVQEILEVEKKYNLPKKKLLKSGYFYFDYLLNKVNLNSENKNILIAPSWNYSEYNFLNNRCKDLINYLINKNFRIIFRPHPEHFKRSTTILTDIKKKFSNFPNFKFDNDKDNFTSMDNSFILITDNSGISIEYLMIYKKPTIFFDEFSKIHNSDYELLNIELFEEKIKKKFGYIYLDNELQGFENKIKEASDQFQFKKEELNNFISKNIYNFGCSVANTYSEFKDD